MPPIRSSSSSSTGPSTRAAAARFSSRWATDDVPRSTASGRDTAYIAAHVPAGTQPGSWFAALEAIAGEVGGRPHWAKLHGLAAGALRARYPRFDEFVAVRDRLDPTGVLGNAYLDRVLGPVGSAGS